MCDEDKTFILHMSDLHFGIENGSEEVCKKVAAYRDTVLEEFLKRYKRMLEERPREKPEILVVSGDIAFTGSADEYESAKKFFERFLNTEGNAINRDCVIVCFGNHDMDGESNIERKDGRFEDKHSSSRGGLTRPGPNIGFNEFWECGLDVEEKYKRFENAEKFCEDMGFVALNQGKTSVYKYAFGARTNVKGIDFVVLNTEWDFWGKGDVEADDKKNNNRKVLRVGVETYLNSARVAGYNDRGLFDLETPPRFVVYHRPLKCLHKHERYVEGSTVADRKTGNLIVEKNDVSLNGHEHKSDVRRERPTHAVVLAGTMYSTDTWAFSCNKIGVPKQLKSGLNTCSVDVIHYVSGDGGWFCDKSGSGDSFGIFRTKYSKQVADFLCKYYELRDSQKKRDGNEEKIKKELQDMLESIPDISGALEAVWGGAYEKMMARLEKRKKCVMERDKIEEQSSSGGFSVRNDGVSRERTLGSPV
jgi:predicted phosphodiesterase